MKAKDLLTDSSRWTKWAYGRDASGRPTHPRNEDAVKFCVIGAIMRAYQGEEFDRALRAVERAIPRRWGKRVSDWNDYHGRTFDQVRRVLEAADV
jgi:hypothetical protein